MFKTSCIVFIVVLSFLRVYLPNSYEVIQAWTLAVDSSVHRDTFNVVCEHYAQDRGLSISWNRKCICTPFTMLILHANFEYALRQCEDVENCFIIDPISFNWSY